MNLNISFDIINDYNAYDIKFLISDNDKQTFATRLKPGVTHVNFDVPDTAEDHVLKITMSGKSWEHTKIDEQGQILEDVIIRIQNLRFDNVLLDHEIFRHCVYEHSYNDDKKVPDKHEFHGTMGCNGTVSFKFYTPIYKWLLENIF